MNDGVELPPRPILLVDDNQDYLALLEDAVAKSPGSGGRPIKTWSPQGQEDAFKTFEKLLSDDIALVVTDYDLTGAARTGLYGSVVIEWCQKRLVPVAAYTRWPDVLSKEVKPFEFRLEADVLLAGPEITAIANGFSVIATKLRNDVGLLSIPSPAAMLAVLVDHPEAGSAFSLYGARASSSNTGIVDAMLRSSSPSPEDRISLLTYVAGHLLYNSILKYPGPLMSRNALCAYLALPTSAADSVVGLFTTAIYAGPFRELGDHFWMEGVDRQLELMARKNMIDYEDMSDTERRAVVEADVGRNLGRHSCDRCQGDRGGYWCPFAKRPVCERKDCSVGSSNLIPQGAGLTRIERDFYDDWIPLLGL